MNTDFETAERKLREEDPTQGKPTVDLIDLLIALAKRKQFILFATIGMGLITAIASFLVPNRFAANATLLPPEQTESSASMLMNQLSGGALGMLAGSGLG